MAGTIITDKIQTENAFLTLNVGQTLVATINSSGILNSSGGIMISANGAVSNTAITGFINGSQLASNTVSNTNIQTGAVENYMNAAGLGFGMRNRIINGGMVIDQRNAGASFAAVDSGYSLDRWKCGSWEGSAQTGKFTVQQNAAAVTPPSGFTYYLGATSSAATSITASAQYFVSQNVEGFNLADFGWGTANAQSATLSFWVRSSLTGTFGGALKNNASRSFPFSFTISTANTWELKTVAITADTGGTWLTTNGTGAQIVFGLGVGSTYSGTAGAWSATNYYSATGAVSVVGTNGATFYITGVQLEKGSTATSFDFRDYGRELIMCQRYLPAFRNSSTTGVPTRLHGTAFNATTVESEWAFLVQSRIPPTGVVVSSAAHFGVGDGVTNITATSLTFGAATDISTYLNIGVASGLTTYRPVRMFCTNASGFFYLTGCEL